MAIMAVDECGDHGPPQPKHHRDKVSIWAMAEHVKECLRRLRQSRAVGTIKGGQVPDGHLEDGREAQQHAGRGADQEDGMRSIIGRFLHRHRETQHWLNNPG
jgi:hypothetical protein